MSQLQRHLPSVETLRQKPPLVALPTAIAIVLAREAIAEVRGQIQVQKLLDGKSVAQSLQTAVQVRCDRLLHPSLRRIINGSGVLLHTNAGRAPLPSEAIGAIAETARGYSNLELSLENGHRDSRQAHLEPLLCWLTGAEAALVVNNGAAAVLLAVHGLAAGRQVLVSRGELVEIGGGFRIPEVMTAAGAALVEVGTTNRTHLRDYERPLLRDATGPKAGQIAALLQVHRSNFALVGFTKTPELADLATLTHAHGKPLIVDVGSGALAGISPDLRSAFDREPLVMEALQQGADLVLFSGDKLVGGPQAGIIVGKRDLVAQLAADPLARALRVDNLTIAALEAVLRMHLLDTASAGLPVTAAVNLSPPEVAERAVVWAELLRAGLPNTWTIGVEASEAQIGGGTDPLVRLPSHCLSLQRAGTSSSQLQHQLLAVPVPIIGRVRGDRLLLDVRTLQAGSHHVPVAEMLNELRQNLLATGGE